MKALREFLSDAVIAAGSAIVVFSAVLVVLDNCHQLSIGK